MPREWTMSERSLKRISNAKIRDAALIDQRHAEIVRGAVKVFKEKGFHVSTVRDIGDAAGLTQGTLYNYVRSKEDILFLVCDQLVQNYQDAVTAAIKAETDPRKRLTSALRAVISTMEAHQEDLLLLYQEVHALERDALRAVLARVAEFIDGFIKLIEESRAHGLIDFSDPRLGAEIITFLPLIVALRRWRFAHYADHRRVTEGLIEFMSRGLGIAVPAAEGRADE
jgi:AcrR family transcriptional regulator